MNNGPWACELSLARCFCIMEHMASVWCLEPPLLVIRLSVHFPNLSSLDILLSVFPIYSLCVLCLLSDLCLMSQCVSVLPCLAAPWSVCFSNKYYPLRLSLYLIPQQHTWYLVQNHIPREREKWKETIENTSIVNL